MEDQPKQKRKRKPQHRAGTVGFGIAIGAGIGAALNNMGVGIAIGIAIGIALDGGYTWKTGKEKKW